VDDGCCAKLGTFVGSAIIPALVDGVKEKGHGCAADFLTLCFFFIEYLRLS
jgi:hypothetical protein